MLSIYYISSSSDFNTISANINILFHTETIMPFSPLHYHNIYWCMEWQRIVKKYTKRTTSKELLYIMCKITFWFNENNYPIKVVVLLISFTLCINYTAVAWRLIWKQAEKSTRSLAILVRFIEFELWPSRPSGQLHGRPAVVRIPRTLYITSLYFTTDSLCM
jgi:hypothetical protein